MQFTLMNKNHKIFDFWYDEKIPAVTKIENIYDLKYLPYIIKPSENREDFIKPLNIWLSTRFQQNSHWFKQISRKNHKIDLITAIYTKSYGLSLSDQYWIKPSNDKKKWEEVNFYTNNFQYKHFLEVGLTDRNYDYEDVDVLYSPDITTGGELGKCWIIDSNKTRILYKTTNTFLGLEPINEMLSTKICKILDVACADYEVKILSNLTKKTLVSGCPTFCSEDIELIPFNDLGIHNESYKQDFEEYLNLLKANGIKEAKEKVSKMLLLDVIISNHDRHMNNYGIIRDSNTLKWIDVAPIYDSGRSMLTYLPNIDLDYDNELFVFNSSGCSHKEVLSLISDLKLTKDQLNDLLSIPSYYKTLLEKYREYTNLKNDRDIELLVEKISKNIFEVIKEYNLENEIEIDDIDM